MTEPLHGDSTITRILAGAYGAASGEGVGTEHLLVAMTGRGGRAAGAALDGVEMTRTVAFAAISAHRHSWVSTDDAEVDPDGPPLGPAEWYHEPKKPMNYTRAARAAMHRTIAAARAAGQTSYGPADLLLALLGDPTNRATELLTTCQVDPAVLRESLRTGQPPAVPDRVAAELRPTRDRLIGRTRLRGTGLVARAYSLLPIPLNWAGAPVMWSSLEAKAQAQQLGAGRPGTDHLLLAILATHEVADHYPHLSERAADLYEGGQRLAAAGVRYRDARDAARANAAALGRDPRRVVTYTKGDGRPQDTGTVLRTLLDDGAGQTRAARLLAAMGVEIPQEREAA